MVGVVKLVGMFMLVFGAIYMAKPTIMKDWLNFWKKGKRMHMGGAINILIGIIFLSSASRCDIPWIVIIVGLISLAKGIAIFVLGPAKMIAKAEGFLKKPPKILRNFSVIALALGILLIYAA